jgi:hypothetical protein
MPDRYWVGGNGTWNGTNTTNWSATSGGAGGASVPTSADNVFINAASGPSAGFTIQLWVSGFNPTCNNLSITQPTTGTLVLNSSPFTSGDVNIYGDVTFSGSRISFTNTPRLYCRAEGKTNTFTQGAVTLAGNLAFDGNATGTHQLGSALTMTSNRLSLYGVNFSLNGYDATVPAIDLSNSGSAVSTTLGSNNIYVTGTGSQNIFHAQGRTFSRTTGQVVHTPLSSGWAEIFLTGTGTPVVGGTADGPISIGPSTTGTGVFEITGGDGIDLTGFTGQVAFGNTQITRGNINIPSSVAVGGNLNYSNTASVVNTISLGGSIGAYYNYLSVFIRGAASGTFRIASSLPTLSTLQLGNITGGGTFDLNGYPVVTSSFDCGTNSGIAWGGAYIDVTGNNRTFSLPSISTISGTPDLRFTYSGSTGTRTFAGAGNTIPYKITAGTDAIAFSSGATCGGLDFTGFAGTANLGNATVSGSLTLSTGMTVAASTNTLTLTGGTSPTITSNGKTLNLPVTMNRSGVTTTLQDAMALGSARTFTLTAGTINLNNYTLTTGAFISTTAGTRSIAFGTGSITITGSGTAWSVGNTAGFSRTGTPTVNISNNSATATTINYGGLSEAQTLSFNFTTGTYTLTEINATHQSLNFTGFAGTVGNATRTVFGGFIAGSTATFTAGSNSVTFAATSGTWNISSSGRTLDFPITFNGLGGTWNLQDSFTVGSTRTTTLTAGTLDLNGFDFSTGLFNSSGSTARTLAFGANQINLTGNGTTIVNISNGSNLTITGTPRFVSTYTGGTGTRLFVGGAANEASAFDISVGGSSGIILDSSATDTVSFWGTFRNVDLGGMTNALNMGGSNTTIFGNLTLPLAPSSFTGGTTAISFAATSGTKTITPNGQTMDFPIAFNGVGGTFELAGALTMGSTRLLTMTAGTLNLAGYTFTAGTVGSSGTSAKNITFNGGTLAVLGASFNNSGSLFTTTQGSAPGFISMTSSSAKTFGGGGGNYGAASLVQSGTGALTITGSSTFFDITNTVSPATVTLQISNTQTVTNFTLSGTAGNLVTLNSNVAGTRATLSDPSGVVSVSNLSIQDIAATGGATWQALLTNGNVNVSNNAGWQFSLGGGSFISFF